MMRAINYKSLLVLSLLTLNLGLSTPCAAVTNSLSTNAPTMALIIGSQANKQQPVPQELTEIQKEELKDKQKVIIILAVLGFVGTGALGAYFTHRTRKERNQTHAKQVDVVDTSDDSPSM